MCSLYIETPLLKSEILTDIADIPVFLKLEYLQPSGSFKNRGIGHLCHFYKKEGKKLLISSSGGNAGLAVAYSGKKLGMPVKVVVPHTTPKLMQDKIRSIQAEVLIHGNSWDEADVLARQLSLQLDAAYISPFDHPLIWEGHSTIVDEIKNSGIKPSAILLSVGGGGLYCGIVKGLQKIGWHDVHVMASETEGASSFYSSLQEKRCVTLPTIQTIASSLGAKKIAQQAYDYSQEHPTIAKIVTDAEAIQACFDFANDHRILVEPACGAALSLIYKKHGELKNYKSAVVIVCGGNIVNFSLLKQWQDKFKSE